MAMTSDSFLELWERKTSKRKSSLIKIVLPWDETTVYHRLSSEIGAVLGVPQGDRIRSLQGHLKCPPKTPPATIRVLQFQKKENER
jgi:hypothetical protein